MRKFIRLLLVASVLYGAGAHWAALQAAAWTSMIAARVGESSWAEAVSSTFSGEKPCRLCRIVEKGSGFDAGASPARPSPALDLAFSVFTALDASLSAVGAPASPSSPGSSPASRPVVPPPKAVLPV